MRSNKHRLCVGSPGLLSSRRNYPKACSSKFHDSFIRAWQGEVKTMQKSALIILIVALGTVASIGAYELYAHRASTDVSSYPPQGEPGVTPAQSGYLNQPSSGAPASNESNGTPSSSLPPQNQPFSVGQASPTVSMPAPAYPNAEKITTTTTTTTLSPGNLTPETPIAAVPVAPGTSYMERTTTQTAATRVKPTVHRAYVHRRAHYKRHSKVHIGRAVKHTAE